MTTNYLDSKRISFASTFRDDFIGGDLWVDNDSATGVSSNKLDFQMLSNGAPSTVSVHDLTSTDNEKWVLRFHSVNFSTLTASSNSFMSFCLSSGNQTLSNNGTQSAIIHRIGYMTGGKYLYAQDINNQAPNGVGADGSDAYTYLINTNYNIEIARTSATTYTVKSFIGGFDGTPVASTSGTCSSGLTGLRYIKIFGDNTHGSESGNFTGTIGKVEFFDGVITASYPTNVQDNSILVEKDTGKRYWFNIPDFDLSELKSYWKFNEASGDIVNQATSIGSTDGLGTTASNLQIAGATYDQTGITANNKSLYFDGSDHGQAGTSASQFNFLHTPNTKWTINFWLKYGGDTAINAILDTNGGGGTARVGLLIDVLADESMQVWMGRGVATTTVVSTNSGASFVPSDSAFHFYSIRYDHTLASSNVKISIDNGTPVTGNKTSDTPSSADSAFPFNIAENCNGYGAFLDGNLTEMSIWNRVLTDAEVTTIYNSGAGKTLDTAKGTATWTYEHALPTISGLKLHLDASDSTTITKDSSNLVSAWNDKSGEGNHISQATASKQPLWVANTQNGLPLIRFDGTDDQLNRSTFVNGAISQGFYMFVVMKPTVGAASNPYNFDGGASARGWCYTDSSDVVRYGSATEQIIDSNLPSTPVMYTFFVNGSSSNVRKNSVSTVSATLGSTSSNGLWLACRHNDTSFGSPDHAEFLFYDNDIGTTNRDAVEAYLKKKWGL